MLRSCFFRSHVLSSNGGLFGGIDMTLVCCSFASATYTDKMGAKCLPAADCDLLHPRYALVGGYLVEMTGIHHDTDRRAPQSHE